MDNYDKRLAELARLHGTPLYVYSLKNLRERARSLGEMDLPFGYTPRYAAKANMNPGIISFFDSVGISFDASSSYEAMELIKLGINPGKISLSSQQPAHNLDELLDLGVQFVATSLHQLKLYSNSTKKQSEVGLRVNPGYGSGANNRTNTGGIKSSFGVWHEYLKDALDLASKAKIKITRLHIHFGSGADPDIWNYVMETSLEIVAKMKDVKSLDIGGGFKVNRFDGEKEADLTLITKAFSDKLKVFADRTGRQIGLEIEPGTWLVAHSGVLISEIVDIVDTGKSGHTFLKLNTGMNDLLRPAIYGAQHKIKVLNTALSHTKYVVVGHNCETGDILTPAKANPEELSDRTLTTANIGDLVVIYDVGAYGRYFSVNGYNSFPPAKEICTE